MHLKRLLKPIVDGKTITMVSLHGMTEKDAEAYCVDVFGRDRFGGFADE